MDTAKACGSPVPFNVEGCGELMLYPLRFTDWGIIERWMRQEILASIKSIACDKDLDNETRAFIVREATREAMRVSMKNEDARKGLLESFEGVMRMVYLSVKRGKPMLSLDDFEVMMAGRFDTLGEMSGIIFSLTFPHYDKMVQDMMEGKEGEEGKVGQEPENPMPKITQ